MGPCPSARRTRRASAASSSRPPSSSGPASSRTPGPAFSLLSRIFPYKSLGLPSAATAVMRIGCTPVLRRSCQGRPPVRVRLWGSQYLPLMEKLGTFLPGPFRVFSRCGLHTTPPTTLLFCSAQKVCSGVYYAGRWGAAPDGPTVRAGDALAVHGRAPPGLPAPGGIAADRIEPLTPPAHS